MARGLTRLLPSRLLTSLLLLFCSASDATGSCSSMVDPSEQPRSTALLQSSRRSNNPSMAGGLHVPETSKASALSKGALSSNKEELADLGSLIKEFYSETLAGNAAFNAQHAHAAARAAMRALSSANSTNVRETRAEMARRALSAESGQVAEMVADDSVQPVDESFDPNLVSGATADLNEAGYHSIATLCCQLEMSVFTERIVSHLGYVVCNYGMMNGVVAWFYCGNQTRTFAELVQEVTDGSDGQCAWVGTESSCPKISSNCPYFPDNGAHRRRNCGYRKVVNTSTTTGAPGAVTTPAETFKCQPDKAVSLDFSQAAVSNNNLGGEGPGTGPEESLVFQNIATYQGSPLNLVVKSSGGYTPGNPSDNGFDDVSGKIGIISVLSGTAVKLTFEFQDDTGAAVSLPEFYFTFLDIDRSDANHIERIYVDGFAGGIENDINDFELELLTDGRTLIKALQTGYDWDDPTDPMNLKEVSAPQSPFPIGLAVDQERRAALLVYRDTSRFTVTLEVSQEEGASSVGRNFMFAGKSSLIDRCPTG